MEVLLLMKEGLHVINDELEALIDRYSGRFVDGLLNRVKAATGLAKGATVMTALLLLLLASLFTRGQLLICYAIGMIYPMVRTIEKLKTGVGLKYWIAYWIILVIFIQCFHILPSMSVRLPLGFLSKITFLVWCYHPSTMGIGVIHEHLFRPLYDLMGLKAGSIQFTPEPKPSPHKVHFSTEGSSVSEESRDAEVQELKSVLGELQTLIGKLDKDANTVEVGKLPDVLGKYVRNTEQGDVQRQNSFESKMKEQNFKAEISTLENNMADLNKKLEEQTEAYNKADFERSQLKAKVAEEEAKRAAVEHELEQKEEALEQAKAKSAAVEHELEQKEKALEQAKTLAPESGPAQRETALDNVPESDTSPPDSPQPGRHHNPPPRAFGGHPSDLTMSILQPDVPGNH